MPLRNHATARRAVARLAGGLALAVLVVAMAACGGGSSAGEPEAAGKNAQAASSTSQSSSASQAASSPDQAAPPSSAPGVFFPRQKASVNTYYMATWRGELVLDREGCLRVRGDGSVVPVWPPGFGVEALGDEVRVLNRRGKVVARVGDEVEIGGGGAPPAAVVDKRTERELRERCPGDYWLASPDVIR